MEAANKGAASVPGALTAGIAISVRAASVDGTCQPFSSDRCFPPSAAPL